MLKKLLPVGDFVSLPPQTGGNLCYTLIGSVFDFYKPSTFLPCLNRSFMNDASKVSLYKLDINYKYI